MQVNNKKPLNKTDHSIEDGEQEKQTEQLLHNLYLLYKGQHVGDGAAVVLSFLKRSAVDCGMLSKWFGH